MMPARRAALAVGLIISLALLSVAAVLPALGSGHIVVDPLTPRSEVTDRVTGQLKIKLDGHPTTVINMKDLSHTVTAKITIQPNAVFPWHTHSGPVLVNVAQGELVYVSSDDCSERVYQAGEAFVDPGHGHVHSAFNRTSGETILFATFLQAAASGPLTITEGVTEPDCVLAP